MFVGGDEEQGVCSEDKEEVLVYIAEKGRTR